MRTARTAPTSPSSGSAPTRRRQLTGNLIEDEKILGTAHVAFGASAAIGGTVQVPVHLDCVVHAARRRDRRRAARPRRRAAGLRLPCCSRSPNFSEGRDPAAIATIDGRVRASAPTCSTSTPTRSTTARSSRSRRPPATSRRALERGARACVERIDLDRARGCPSADRRARRLPGRLARPEPTASARGRRRSRSASRDRRARAAGVPLRRAGAATRRASRARLLSPRRARGADRADARRRARARLRAAAAAPDRGRDPGHRAPAARRLQPAARQRRRRGRARDRGGAARVGRRPARGCGRSGSTSTAAPRSRPTSTTRSRCRSAVVIERVRELAAEHGARPSSGEVVGLRPRGGAARPPRRSRRSTGFDPAPARARAAAAAGQLASRPMAQTRRKRRRKHRGTQAGQHRPPRPARAPAHPRGGEGAGEAANGATGAICRRPGAARSRAG